MAFRPRRTAFPAGRAQPVAGQGIVPENALARAFRDQAGRLNQRMAALADRVLMMVAGLPVTVKDEDPDPTD